MRLALSAIGGSLVTLAMLLAGLHFFDGRYNKASLRPVIEVQPLPGASRVDVAEWLRETRGDQHQDERAALDSLLAAPPPRWEPERRDISGFVQLSFTVRPDGSVTDIEVFGSMPPGIYEQRAMEIVAARRYQPDYDADGNPIARRGIEVIDFAVPAAGAPRPEESPQ